MKPEGPLASLLEGVYELERRHGASDPFYMAKFIMGNGNRRDNKLWGWNRHHEMGAALLWWGYKTRFERPWGTTVYLEWCRGSRKSTLGYAFYVCALKDDPNLTCLLETDKNDKAKEKSVMVRDTFDDPYFKFLFGDLKGDLWTKERWNLRRTVRSSDPSMKSAGLETSKTGGHHDIIDMDDVQTDDNADSVTVNEDVKRDYRLSASLQSGKPAPMKVVLGTRWGFRDLGNDIQMEADDEIRRGLPRSVFIYRVAAHPPDVNGKLDLRRANFAEGGLTPETLRRYKNTQKPSLYAFNYLLQPQSEDEATFRAAWIEHHSKAFADFNEKETRVYIAVDPGGDGSTGKKADGWAFVVVAIEPTGEIFVLHAETKARLTRKDGLDKIVELVEFYHPQGVVVEQYFKAKQMTTWMKDKSASKLLSIPWMTFKQDKRSKDNRIQALQPFMQMHRLYWRAEHHELEDQMLQHPRGEHDDLPDCLALAVQYASVPQTSTDKPWYAEKDWGEKKLGPPEAGRPDAFSVMVAAAEYLKDHRVHRRRGRFQVGGLHGGR